MRPLTVFIQLWLTSLTPAAQQPPCSDPADQPPVTLELEVDSSSSMAVIQVSFTTIARGPNSGIDEPRQVVVRAAEQWQALWRQHSTEPAPTVDFEKHMVAGVFLGSRPTAGYDVEVVRIVEVDGGLRVEYRTRRPAPDRIVAQVITAPFHLVRLPQTAGTVRFEALAAEKIDDAGR
jgi:hypothetical protein